MMRRFDPVPCRRRDPQAIAGSFRERSIAPAIGALLAGGSSRRMGNPKSESDLGGKPLAAWAAASLTHVTPRAFQVGGSDLPTIGLPLLHDLRSGAGPAAGLEAALEAGKGVPVVLVAADSPFVPPELLRFALSRVRAGAAAAAPRFAGRWHPLCAAYAPGLLSALRRRLDAGTLDLHGLLDAVGAVALGERVVAAYGPPSTILLNVNDRDDLERARLHLGV